MKINEFPTPKKRLSPLKSIKFYCKELCCAGDQKSWRDCSAERCVLWKYRLGVGNRKKGSKTALYNLKKSKIKQSDGGLK